MLIAMTSGSWGCHHPCSGRVARHDMHDWVKFTPLATFSPPSYGMCSSEHIELHVNIFKLQTLLHQLRIAASEMQELNMEKIKKIGKLEDEVGVLKIMLEDLQIQLNQ